jgi:hypothetical protein
MCLDYIELKIASLEEGLWFIKHECANFDFNEISAQIINKISKVRQNKK